MEGAREEKYNWKSDPSGNRNWSNSNALLTTWRPGAPHFICKWKTAGVWNLSHEGKLRINIFNLLQNQSSHYSKLWWLKKKKKVRKNTGNKPIHKLLPWTKVNKVILVVIQIPRALSKLSGDSSPDWFSSRGCRGGKQNGTLAKKPRLKVIASRWLFFFFY